MDIDDYVSVAEAVTITGYKQANITLLCRQGKLPGARKLGPRQWLIPRQALLDYRAGPRGQGAVKITARALKKLMANLQGTEKQVAWAEKIRTAFFALPPHSGLERAGPKVSVAVKRALAQEPSAAWWIDHQAALNPPFFSGRAVQRLSEFLKLQMNEDEDAFWKDVQNHMEKMSPAEIVRFFLYVHGGKEDNRKPEIFDAEVQKCIVEEARRTLRPSEPKSDLLWRIEETEDKLCLLTPKRNDEVATMARRLGFAWQDGCWCRKKPGTDDMAVEIACRLLTMGLPVQLPRVELVPRVAEADYEPYATKTVLRSTKGNFIIRWAWEDGNFYDILKHIPGAKWDSEKRWTVVPRDRYNEVLDFAEDNGFKVSEDAQRLVEEAEAIYKAALVMDVKEKTPRKREPPETGGIDEELLDKD